MHETDSKPQKREPQALDYPARAQVTWSEIGESFETMGKIGLALAVGMSAAGLFCRLADQGKVRLPPLSDLVIPRNEPGRSAKKDPEAQT